MQNSMNFFLINNVLHIGIIRMINKLIKKFFEATVDFIVAELINEFLVTECLHSLHKILMIRS